MFKRRFKLIGRVVIRTSNPDFNTLQEISDKMQKSVMILDHIWSHYITIYTLYIHYYQLNIVVY